MESQKIKKNKSKIYALVSAIILVITVIGSTLALVYYRSDTTYVNLTFESNLGAFINYSSGNPVLGSEGTILNSGSDYTSGISTEIEFWKTPEAHNMDIYGHIYLDITSGSSELLNMEGLKWAVTSNDILISEGNFIGYSVGTSLPILVNQKLISSLTKFTIYVWIDENNLGTVAGEDETFSVSVRCEATSGEYERFGGGEFDYTGNIQTVTLTKGTYVLETWGAQGGYGMNDTYRGGYGGYSIGTINLTENTTLYIAIGGQGGNGVSKVNTLNAGGYNGGGNTYGTTKKYLGSGGGATHIALSDGLLSTLSESTSNILIVSGGGGAGGYESASYNSTGGDAGGYIGNDGTTTNTSHVTGKGGTQTAGGTGLSSGSFGQGGNATSDSIGGGGGYYGGGVGKYSSGSGGGSGYIGNTLLTNKVMYCYNCSESSEESTKTVSTTCVSEEATSNCAKMGNGYARITSNATIKVLPRVTVSNGTDYNFKENISSEIPSGYTITYSTYDNASTLSSGEYQIKYIAEDSNGNEYTYYQKVEIV